MKPQMDADSELVVDWESRSAAVICDRCANMKVEELQRVRVGRRIEWWCAKCCEAVKAFQG